MKLLTVPHWLCQLAQPIHVLIICSIVHGQIKGSDYGLYSEAMVYRK